MIPIAAHINKLEALKLYMCIWVEHSHACQTLIAMLLRKEVLGPIPYPTPLPSFETWYEMHQVANN